MKKLENAPQALTQAAAGSIPALLQQARHYCLSRQYDACEAETRRIIAMDATCAPAWNLFGLSCRHLGRMEEAAKAFEKAISLDETLIQAHYNLADFWMALRQWERAILSFRRVLELEPTQSHSLIQISDCHLHLGYWSEAMQWGKKACRAVPNDPRAWQCVLSAYRAPDMIWERDEAWEAFLLASLADPLHVNATMLTVLMRYTTRQLPGIPHLITLASNKDDAALRQAYDAGEVAAALSTPLLLAQLHYGAFPLAEVERLLTAVRALLLEDVVQREGILSLEKFFMLLALSTQCLLNEHVYPVSSKEKDLLEQVKARLSSLPVNSDNNYMTWVFMLGCYQRLEREPWAGAVDGFYEDFTPGIQDYCREFIREPRNEMGIKLSIPSLTPISSGVSSFVREQYEANPYPRWRTLQRVASQDVMVWVKNMFPAFPAQRIKVGSPCRILVAGSGTGQHPIGTALKFKDAEVLSIDLSRSSLAYAERKRREIGVENLTLMQGDILMLDKLRDVYDIVESSGVLHHMENPMEGWEILTRKLKSGGLMSIGLYSQLARKDVIAMRERIARERIGESADSIRSLRQQVMDTPDAIQAYKFMMQRDFFSLSECRDLLFHRQEHQFTLPQIESILERLGLDLIGFVNGNPLANIHYREMFPEDLQMNSLANWHQLEMKYPQTFVGMYQMWLLKR